MAGSIGRLALAAAVLTMVVTPLTAQTVALGTTQGGATGQLATAIAQVVSQQGKIQVVPQALANTAQYIPLVDEGRLEFGTANLPQTAYAVAGTGMSAGQPAPNLRMVATLFPFNAGLVATKQSGMTGYADLRGKRLPAYPEGSLGDFIMRAALAAGGVGWDEVTRVPTTNFPKQFEDFKAGAIDVAIAAVGSQPTFDFEASIPGGIRYLSFDAEDEAAVAELLPGTRLRTIEAATALPGIEPDIRVFSYDYTIFAHKDVADDVVHAFVEGLYEGADALRATGPLWEEYDPDLLGRDVGLDYHPGAMRFFEERGIFGRS
jgi:TRAP transporter TAXI family solute receptor